MEQGGLLGFWGNRKEPDLSQVALLFCLLQSFILTIVFDKVDKSIIPQILQRLSYLIFDVVVIRVKFFEMITKTVYIVQAKEIAY